MRFVAEIDFEWERGRLFDQLPAIVLYEMVGDAGRARIIRVDHQPRTKHKPIPLSTVCLGNSVRLRVQCNRLCFYVQVELQKRASRFLRLSGERTMKAAEELYQKGYDTSMLVALNLFTLLFVCFI